MLHVNMLPDTQPRLTSHSVRSCSIATSRQILISHQGQSTSYHNDHTTHLLVILQCLHPPSTSSERIAATSTEHCDRAASTEMEPSMLLSATSTSPCASSACTTRRLTRSKHSWLTCCAESAPSSSWYCWRGRSEQSRPGKVSSKTRAHRAEQ